MGKVLTILEVSRKQAYIFASRRLRENAARSADIARVTSPEYFQKTAGSLYGEENLVYSGGGHTVLQFPDRESAVAFTRTVTAAVLREYGGLELFAAHADYDPLRTPGENLSALTEALERKKALRAASFRQLSFGVEALDSVTLRPVPVEAGGSRGRVSEPVPPPEGWRFPAELDELAGRDNFIAVVHLDGNGMGARVKAIYDNAGDWDACRRSLRRYSDGIQESFERAFKNTVKAVIEGLGVEPGPLPIRPVILAGDDVCFVTRGELGLECARICLEELRKIANPEDGRTYAACAGVALVHRKYPFYRAYELTEELCSNAKRFGVSLDKNGGVSAMDWHIEFGQLKGGLSELRMDYETDDGNRLELRPVAVLLPEGLGADAGVRTYSFFRKMCAAIQEERGRTGRGKLKDLRGAMKQGEVETRFFMHDREITRLLDHVSTGEFRGAFQQLGDKKRCLFFDAIEMADHWTVIRGADEDA